MPPLPGNSWTTRWWPVCGQRTGTPSPNHTVQFSTKLTKHNHIHKRWNINSTEIIATDCGHKYIQKKYIGHINQAFRCIQHAKTWNNTGWIIKRRRQKVITKRPHRICVWFDSYPPASQYMARSNKQAATTKRASAIKTPRTIRENTNHNRGSIAKAAPVSDRTVIGYV